MLDYLLIKSFIFKWQIKKYFHYLFHGESFLVHTYRKTNPSDILFSQQFSKLIAI